MSQAATDTEMLEPLRRAEELVKAGRKLEAIELLHRANREEPTFAFERRLAELRYAAFPDVVPSSIHHTWPVAVDDVDRSAAPTIPQIEPDQLDATSLRRAIRSHGSAWVPGLLDPQQVDGFVSGIQQAIAIRADNAARPYAKTRSPWFSGLPLPQKEGISLGRGWIAGAGGMLAADSPRLLDRIFATYEELGLRDVLTEYLGEGPILSANKCTLREVPLTANTDWHQDGAFLGTGIRAVNVWIALTDCGVEAPGMDIVPRRFEAIQETGTGGAIFDWAVGPDTVARLSVDHPVVRPQFMAGDALIFDDLLLHRSAIEPGMIRPRYAIESWFFAATDYPTGQVPLVW